MRHRHIRHIRHRHIRHFVIFVIVILVIVIVNAVVIIIIVQVRVLRVQIRGCIDSTYRTGVIIKRVCCSTSTGRIAVNQQDIWTINSVSRQSKAYLGTAEVGRDAALDDGLEGTFGLCLPVVQPYMST